MTLVASSGRDKRALLTCVQGVPIFRLFSKFASQVYQVARFHLSHNGFIVDVVITYSSFLSVFFFLFFLFS